MSSGKVAAARRWPTGLWSLLVVVALAWGASAWLREHEQGQWAKALQDRARPGDVTLLSSRACLYCDRARAWLTRHAVPFDECFIESDARCRQRYAETGERGTPTVLVRDQVQLGFSPERVAFALGALP